MRKHRTLILGLVLALFQIQVFAAATLGCLHAGGVDASTSLCPNHLPVQNQSETPADRQADPAGADDDLGTLDCTKCALTLGLHAIPGGVAILPVLQPRSPAVASQACHFYRHAPDAQLRPPILSRA
jgi:hypothetical protein